MRWLCFFGFHDWGADCDKCARCGAERTGAHRWSNSRCSACGKTRDPEPVPAAKEAATGRTCAEGHFWVRHRCLGCKLVDPEMVSTSTRIAAAPPFTGHTDWYDNLASEGQHNQATKRLVEVLVEEEDDQVALERIEVTSELPAVRSAACKKLEAMRAASGKSGPLLLQLTEDPNEEVRAAATRRLTDPDVLATIAETNAVWKARAAATRKLVDQSILARIATSDVHQTVRAAAVALLEDQVLLGKIARTDVAADVCAIALYRLKDPELLARALMVPCSVLDHNPGTAGIVARVTDQSALGTIARTSKVKSVVSAAIANLTDQAVLSDLASCGEWMVEVDAVKRLTHQPTLTTVALTHRDAHARQLAVERLDDQEVLGRCARDDRAQGVRCAAIRKLRDPVLLQWIAANVDRSHERLQEPWRENAEARLRLEQLGHPRRGA